VNTRHSHYQYYIQANSQLYSTAALLHGKEHLAFTGGVFAVVLMNMVDPLSAARAMVIQCITIYCTKLPNFL